MKTITKVLIGVLGITSLVPIKLGWICLFNHSGAAEFFAITTLTPDVERLFTVLGCFVLATVVVQLLALVWIVRQYAYGFSLAMIVGIISMGRGACMLFLFGMQDSNSTRISTAPLVIGAFILILSVIARGKQAHNS